jgi:hypothetical protein
MLLPAALGLLLNSIHEKMDPSVVTRLALYAISILVFGVTLFYTGSVEVWICLGGGLGVFFVFAGREYIKRNARGLVLTGFLVCLLAFLAAVSLVASDHHPVSGYGRFPEETVREFSAWGEMVRGLWRFPALGRGFATGPGDSPASSVAGLLRCGGIPGLFILVLFFVHAVRRLYPPLRSDVEEYDIPRIDVSRRRDIPAIALSIMAVFGGGAAIVLLPPRNLPVSDVLFVVALGPLWLIFLSLSYSYKHFALSVYNKRDFVTLGMAGSATAFLLFAVLQPVLFDFHTAFAVFALLAVGGARAARDSGREGELDLRSRRLLRAGLGLTGGLVAAVAVALLMAVWSAGVEALL